MTALNELNKVNGVRKEHILQVSALLVACKGILSGSDADDNWTGLYDRIQRVLQGSPNQIATCSDGKLSSLIAQNKAWHSYI